MLSGNVIPLPGGVGHTDSHFMESLRLYLLNLKLSKFRHDYDVNSPMKIVFNDNRSNVLCALHLTLFVFHLIFNVIFLQSKQTQ